MSFPPSSAASPPPVSAMVDTLELTFAGSFLALVAICSVTILFFMAFNFYKSRYDDESESGDAAAEALPAVRERETVQIEARVFSYREADGGHDDECAICLDGFKEGQKCRGMNKCGHIFHRSCIDRWLEVDCHCPLCRTCICIVVHP